LATTNFTNYVSNDERKKGCSFYKGMFRPNPACYDVWVIYAGADILVVGKG
jgi:hypothetical protein